MSAADIRQSISLNPHNPWSYYRLMGTMGGEGNTPELQAAFETAIKAFPQYYQLYQYRLNMLTPKWGGSLHDMYGFVAQYAHDVPDNSPMKLLYLQVYADVLNAAWFDCRSAAE